MNDYKVVVTDTANGEANYCWKNEYIVKARSIKSALTIAKKTMYCSPVPRHRLHDYGDELAAYLIDKNVVFFVSIN